VEIIDFRITKFIEHKTFETEIDKLNNEITQRLEEVWCSQLRSNIITTGFGSVIKFYHV
jgi:hypothetical protein